MDFTDKPPDDPNHPPKAPTSGDADKTALLYRAIMAEADQSITNLIRKRLGRIQETALLDPIWAQCSNPIQRRRSPVQLCGLVHYSITASFQNGRELEHQHGYCPSEAPPAVPHVPPDTWPCLLRYAAVARVSEDSRQPLFEIGATLRQARHCCYAA